jgi:hypothetical protein
LLAGTKRSWKNNYYKLIPGFWEATSDSALIKGVKVIPGSSEMRKYIAYIPEIVQLISKSQRGNGL